MTLELEVLRRWFSPKTTIGELRIEGVFECFTLEDFDRLEAFGDDVAHKVKGETAIPAGRYRVTLEPSPAHGGVLMPRLHDVPGFVGILIHSGNWAKDTLGCVLVGRQRGEDEILSSRVAYDALFAKLQAAKAAGVDVWLTIKRAPLSERALS